MFVGVGVGLGCSTVFTGAFLDPQQLMYVKNNVKKVSRKIIKFIGLISWLDKK